MSTRLQVVLDDRELSEVREAAKRAGMTVSEWVRQAMRQARRGEPTGRRATKLATVRVAARHAYPTADIDVMLAQIESGYGQHQDM